MIDNKNSDTCSLTQIDASFEESGGQIYRLSLGLAAILQKPLHIFNIRSKRPNPGLSRQHLALTQLIGYISNADITNDYIGSTDLTFVPDINNRSIPLKISKDIGTAGALSLVIQGLIPCLLLLPFIYAKNNLQRTNQSSINNNLRIELSLIGGTNVSHSPPIDHVQHILLPILSLLGVQSELSINKRGFYPKGQGKVTLFVNPLNFNYISIFDFTQQGAIIGVKVILCGTGIYFNESFDEFSTISSFYLSFKEKLLIELQSFLEKRKLDIALSYLLKNRKDIFRVDRNCYDNINSLSDNRNVSQPHKETKRNKQKYHHQMSCFSVQICLLTTNQIPISANVLIETKTSSHCISSSSSSIDDDEISFLIKKLLAQLAHVVDSGACLDEYTADQLIIYMGLAVTTTASIAFGNDNNNTNNEKKCRILCAPKNALCVKNPSTTSSTNNNIVEQSSLHLESAMHITSLLTGCTFYVEENPINKCRLITATAK